MIASAEEEMKEVEKVSTPDAHTIEKVAEYLQSKIGGIDNE